MKGIVYHVYTVERMEALRTSHDFLSILEDYAENCNNGHFFTFSFGHDTCVELFGEENA